MNVDLKLVEKVLNDFDRNDEELKKELKRLQSIKCRLKKQKFKKDYNKEMTEVLKNEQVLKECRQLLNPREKFITEMTENDIKKLTYDEVVKGIRSIQSKKTLTKHLTEKPGDNDEYRMAIQIENWLLEQKSKLKPVEDNLVKKTEVEKIINTIEESGKLSQKEVLELLKKLV